MKLSFLSESSDQQFRELLDSARSGDPDALGKLMEWCRPYLLKIAHEEGDTNLQAKEADSDVVQGTCLDALRAFERFRGQSSSEMFGWLRQILLNRLKDLRVKYQAAKRDIRVEKSLQSFETGDSRNDNSPVTTDTPSAFALRNEERELVERALAELSEMDRRVVEMRQKDGQAFADIARQLHLTEDAARKRWARAIQTLQEKVLRPNELPYQ